MNLSPADASELKPTDKVLLTDCIQDFFKTENLDADNLLFCENC